MKTTLKKIRIWLFPIAIIMMLAGCVYNPFYYPDSVVYDSPKNNNLPFETILFPSKDGTKLSAWFIPAKNITNPKKAKATVIFFHGNAQNMTANWNMVSWLPEEGFNLFTFDYRGFGDSEGKGTESFKGLFEDSLAAIDYVRNRPDVDPEKLVIYAQSLGGNNAISTVGSGDRQGIKAMVVEGTFYSYPAIASDKVPGVGWLINNQYSASKYIKNISPIPLLLIHGDRDNVIGDKHSIRLFEEANEPKALVIVPTGRHIEAMKPRFNGKYRKEMVTFFEDALKQPKPKEVIAAQ